MSPKYALPEIDNLREGTAPWQVHKRKRSLSGTSITDGGAKIRGKE